MSDEVESIIEVIRSAFLGVPRGCITIHEAEVIDEYGSAEERQEARRLDTEESWDQVADTDIEECTTALCHLDPAGWRFYLPAYMIWSLRNFRLSDSFATDHTIYSLDPDSRIESLREYHLERFRQLNEAQSIAVCRFLRYMAAVDHDNVDATAAEIALDEFWGGF